MAIKVGVISAGIGASLAPALHMNDGWAEGVYFPLQTALLAHAAALVCRMLNGGGMAVFQAVRAFKLFADRPADALGVKADFSAMIDPSKIR